MLKDNLLQLLEQNRKDCAGIFNKITPENAAFRLTERTASVAFIYRHVAETFNLLAQDFGFDSASERSTIGQSDHGISYDLETSRALFNQGYETFQKIINETSEQDWLSDIKTRWFGKTTRIKLFSISLNHNSHHCGQAASALAKGRVF